MTEAICPCGRPVYIKSAGLCRRCYMANWKAANPERVAKYNADAKKHPRKRSYQPRPLNLGMYPKKPLTTPCGYYAAHQRVRQHRGKASDYPCKECGKPAEQWAYNNDFDSEYAMSAVIERKRSHGKPGTAPMRQHWSRDIREYDPLCIKCHARRDASVFTNGRFSEQTPSDRPPHFSFHKRVENIRERPDHGDVH